MKISYSCTHIPLEWLDFYLEYRVDRSVVSCRIANLANPPI